MYDRQLDRRGAPSVIQSCARGEQARVTDGRYLQQLLIVMHGLLGGPRRSGEGDQL